MKLNKYLLGLGASNHFRTPNCQQRAKGRNLWCLLTRSPFIGCTFDSFCWCCVAFALKYFKAFFEAPTAQSGSQTTSARRPQPFAHPIAPIEVRPLLGAALCGSLRRTVTPATLGTPKTVLKEVLPLETGFSNGRFEEYQWHLRCVLTPAVFLHDSHKGGERRTIVDIARAPGGFSTLPPLSLSNPS